MADASFYPLPDEASCAPLLEQAASLIAEGHRLSPVAGGVIAALRPLLRCMNSYYSNKIEGQHTRPVDIQRALDSEFDADLKQARKQRLALAHIDAEQALEAHLPAERIELYAPEFIRSIHAALYERLPDADRKTDDAQEILLVPGEHRSSALASISRPLRSASLRCSWSGSKPTANEQGSSRRWWPRSALITDCSGFIHSSMATVEPRGSTRTWC
jgi:hypothetical protein